MHCSASVPQRLAGVFRPPEDCAVCRGLRQIDRVANTSWAALRQRYTSPGRPVVVTDATRNWTAQQVFSFRFLETVHAQFPPPADCQAPAAPAAPAATPAAIGEDDFNASSRPGLEPWHISW
ncbi:uncharacterized protein LOC134535374 [Bacillus rossius redtenbacheri]|uniref:uncharacterized protein LOC134535374 n=1 Tax=Bacillus rossius redtenbacheri TaxID=93214 RepID=UPI002FDCBAC5